MHTYNTTNMNTPSFFSSFLFSSLLPPLSTFFLFLCLFRSFLSAPLSRPFFSVFLSRPHSPFRFFSDFLFRIPSLLLFLCSISFIPFPSSSPSSFPFLPYLLPSFLPSPSPLPSPRFLFSLSFYISTFKLRLRLFAIFLYHFLFFPFPRGAQGAPWVPFGPHGDSLGPPAEIGTAYFNSTLSIPPWGPKGPLGPLGAP